MCDMGSISAASKLPLGGTSTTDVAGASGGGPVAATGASLSPDVVAQLQASIDAISALTSALGGSSALGSAPVSAGGPGVVQQTPVQAGGDTMPDMPGMPGMPATKGMKMPKGSSHHMVMQRTTPVDTARAQKIANAVKQFFGGVKRSQVTFKQGGSGTHGVLPESLRKQFKAKYPDLPAPRSIVFPKGSSKPIGVVYNEKVNGNFDLGMGVKHKHSDAGNAMEHVWFTPSNLDLAYADSAGGTMTKVKRALGVA
jgi:hypothetical protein